MQEFMKLKGVVKVELFGPDGVLKQSHEDHNLIVTVGKNYITAWLAAATQSTEFMSYVGLGTGTTSPASGDTALQTELSGGGYTRVQGTLTSLTNTWTNTVSFGPGNGTAAITEAGLFSTITSGTMFARQVFAAYNKAAGDTLQITWSVSFN